jgi:hypothetical protein
MCLGLFCSIYVFKVYCMSQSFRGEGRTHNLPSKYVARSQWPRRSKGWVCGRSHAGIVGSNPAGAWMSISCECCVLLGRGLCIGLITRLGESYRVWRVCDREASIMRMSWPTRSFAAWGKKVGKIKCSLCFKAPLILNWCVPDSSVLYSCLGWECFYVANCGKMKFISINLGYYFSAVQLNFEMV